jgi:HSP20 family protein
MSRIPRLWIEPFGMAKKMDRIFNEFSVDACESPSFGGTDVYEKDGALVFESELPGAKKEDINVKVEDGQLVISGETSRQDEVARENFFRRGRRFGKFNRSFTLPEEVRELENIEAQFEDGILKVRVPLNKSIKEKDQPLEIKIG